MHRSHARLTGHMALTLLGPDGRPLARHENHNSVVTSGRRLLLGLLKGDLRASNLQPVLGDQDFDPDSLDMLSSEKAIPLKEVETVEAELGDDTLTLGFRGTAGRDANVIGGGILVTTQARQTNKKGAALYNFARTPNTVRVKADLPLMLTFTLSVG